MRSSDGGIWRLRWWQEGESYLGEVVGHPRVCAKAATFEDMADALADEVRSKLQAGEWTADWDPPPPLEPGSIGEVLKSHVKLNWEGRFVALQAPSDVFSSFCTVCGSATSERTSNPLRVVIESHGNMCGDFGSLPGHVKIFTRELADVIMELSGPTPGVSFRPVQRLGRGRKQYVEPVIDPHTTLPATVPMRVTRKWDWLCDACGSFSNYVNLGGTAPTRYYRATDISGRNDAFWIHGDGSELDICVPLKWWREHRRLPYLNGVVSSPVGLARTFEVDPHPARRPHSELASHNRFVQSWKHHQKYTADAVRLAFDDWTI